MSADKILVPRDLLKAIRSSLAVLPKENWSIHGAIDDLLAQPSDGALTNEVAEPAAWANDQQLLLCSKSPLDELNPNPAARRLPSNIAGSALRDDYCNTPLYRRPPAPASVVLPDSQWGGPFQDGWNACLDRVKELNS